MEITPEAEADYADEIQDALKKTVWSSGCDSWYVRKEDGVEWNAMSYPYSQGHFWYRSLFPRWRDWSVKVRDSKWTDIAMVSAVLMFP